MTRFDAADAVGDLPKLIYLILLVTPNLIDPKNRILVDFRRDRWMNTGRAVTTHTFAYNT